ncbi:MAG TPA: HAD family hydrolase [Dehalococcoidia bacterium]|nr:HAD family hydrolase [Dehalococcoidia bacterium]
MTIRAIIFDLGHTLWDIGDSRDALERAYVQMHATLCARLDRDDLPEPAALQRAVYDVLVASSKTYFSEGPNLDQPPSHVWIDRGCRALGIELDEPLLREITPPIFASERDALTCGEGTLDAVRDLHARGYVLGCVTNTLADTATIRAMLRDDGFEELMTSVVVSADEGWRKPHPSLFEKALRETGVAPDDAVFVGDSPLHDIGGAKAVGMHAVLTQQYVARPYEGFDPQPDAIISHLRELHDVINHLQLKT